MLTCLDEAELLAPECADPRAGLHVLAARVLSSAATGDFERSRDAALEGLARAEQLSSPKWSGRFEVWCGMIDHQRGDDTEAGAVVCRRWPADRTTSG